MLPYQFREVLQSAGCDFAGAEKNIDISEGVRSVRIDGFSQTKISLSPPSTVSEFGFSNSNSWPAPSSCLFLTVNDEILIESEYTGDIYNLNDCIGDTIENAVYSIGKWQKRLRSGYENTKY